MDGPISLDHSLGIPNGWYLFASAYDRDFFDKARIETSLIPERKCMEFYYYFSANSKFKFNIYTKINNQISESIWSRSSSQGDIWRLGRVTINIPSTYKIIMELTNIINGGLDDKFGIDDVYISNGICQESSDVNSLCSFTSDTCGYTIDTKTQFQWKLFLPAVQFSEPKATPLPINDHTTDGVGSGYLYAETIGFKKDDAAVLTSQIYTPLTTTTPSDAARCLEFYFYIQGTNAVKLNVRAFQTTSFTKFVVWTRDYDHSKFWWKGEANLKFISNYTILFEAVVGNNSNNGLAGLDDIILRNGECSR